MEEDTVGWRPDPLVGASIFFRGLQSPEESLRPWWGWGICSPPPSSLLGQPTRAPLPHSVLLLVSGRLIPWPFLLPALPPKVTGSRWTSHRLSLPAR